MGQEIDLELGMVRGKVSYKSILRVKKCTMPTAEPT